MNIGIFCFWVERWVDILKLEMDKRRKWMEDERLVVWEINYGKLMLIWRLKYLVCFEFLD